MSKKTVAFLPNHPSQIWVLRPIAESLSNEFNVIWFLRDKDISLALADRLGISYIVLSKARSGYVGNGIEFFLNFFKCLYYTLFKGIDVWVTKYGCGSIAAFLCGRTAIGFNDDDTDVVPLIAATCYPFSAAVIVPNVIRMGRYQSKAIAYPSGHELFYLHPNRYTPSREVYKHLGISEDTKYALIRLSALQAHHDAGIGGVSTAVVRKVIQLAEDKGIRVFITSEKPLDKEFEEYRLPIPPDQIHDALYFAEFLLGDSQTMTTEAAALGTAAFRLSDFVGRISYIDHLEKAGVCFGYKPQQADQLLTHIQTYLADPAQQAALNEAHRTHLQRNIDPVPWFAGVISKIAQGTCPEHIEKPTVTVLSK